MSVWSTVQGSFRRGSANGNSKWFSRVRLLELPRLRLFCFPYAGAGASVFQKWATDIVDGVDVVAIQLPGRESRLKEPLVRDLSVIVGELRQAMQPLLDVPTVFFGHSIGAIIAFELARELRRTGLSANLQALFVSGGSSPHKRAKQQAIHDLPREEFLAALRGMNGTSEAVFAHPELLDILIPILRNDFFISETYRYVEAPPLDIPIVAFGGEADKEVTSEQLIGWKDQTTVRPYCCTMFAGDHFFINSNRQSLLAALNDRLSVILRQAVGGMPAAQLVRTNA